MFHLLDSQSTGFSKIKKIKTISKTTEQATMDPDQITLKRAKRP